MLARRMMRPSRIAERRRMGRRKKTMMTQIAATMRRMIAWTAVRHSTGRVRVRPRRPHECVAASKRSEGSTGVFQMKHTIQVVECTVLFDEFSWKPTIKNGLILTLSISRVSVEDNNR